MPMTIKLKFLGIAVADFDLLQFRFLTVQHQLYYQPVGLHLGYSNCKVTDLCRL